MDSEAPAEDEAGPTRTATAASRAEGDSDADRGPREQHQLDQRLLRALADLDNMRKRYSRELARERAAERARIAAAWLPLVDDLARALEFADDQTDPLTLGVRAVYEEALALLARLGYPRFDDVGQPFDPARHEAVGAIESEAPAGTVVTAVRPGYGTDEELLRPAGVIVARQRDSR
jgi:molecular chaperone GrpE